MSKPRTVKLGQRGCGAVEIRDGLSEGEARSSIRLGFGRYTSEEELRTALGLINEAAARQGAL